MKKLTDGRRTPSDGNTSPDPPFGSGELKKKENIYISNELMHIIGLILIWEI